MVTAITHTLYDIILSWRGVGVDAWCLQVLITTGSAALRIHSCYFHP